MGTWPLPRPRPGGSGGVRRLLDLPMYRGDQIVRNAPALQKTADNPPPSALMSQAMIDHLGLTAGDQVIVRNGDGRATLPLRADQRIPHNCVYVPAGYAETARAWRGRAGNGGAGSMMADLIKAGLIKANSIKAGAR